MGKAEGMNSPRNMQELLAMKQEDAMKKSFKGNKGKALGNPGANYRAKAVDAASHFRPRSKKSPKIG